MTFFLVASVILNLLLLVIIIIGVVNHFILKHNNEFIMDEWRKWEENWYQAQEILMNKYDLFLNTGINKGVNIEVMEKRNDKS